MGREEWGPGPWQDEPDRVEWRHASLPCLVVRGPMGALCGYVGVPPGHPLHGRSAFDGSCDELDAPGGLTFAGPCEEGGDICHVPQPGEPANVWWLGFDCAHAYDLVPGLDALTRRNGGRAFSGAMNEIGGVHVWYKPLAYVRSAVESLAEQLRALTPSARAPDRRPG